MSSGLIAAKSIAIVANIAGALVGILPALLLKKASIGPFHDWIDCIAAGAFFGLAIAHLIPEGLHYIAASGGFAIELPGGELDYIWLFIIAGYASTLFVDKILSFSCKPDSKSFKEMADHQSTIQAPANSDSPSSSDDDVSSLKDSKDLELQASDVIVEHENLLLTLVALIVPISFHCVFEGIAIGLVDTAAVVAVLTLSVVLHKWAVGFAIGIRMRKMNASKWMKIIFTTIFVISTPIGISIGWIASQNADFLTIGLLTAFAAGGVLYFGTDHANHVWAQHKSWRKFALFVVWLVTVGVMFSLMILHLLVHDHTDDGHDHDHDH